ncbi:MAG: hypothetical protein MJZ34_07225 [Paludibacteraceae bacterium]|nr:hypothetical protein [Paludibacteraceae bacterium]
MKLSELLETNIKEYAIEVAEDRALPSFRDGMKPSQRRLIKALLDKNATFDKKTIKSAQIVGDAMGNYHPHGDSGLAGALETLVNQPYNIVYGQGNWGSLTDGAASTRYTECKLSDLGMKYIECYEVADEVPNYTGEKLEPVDFPTRFPAYFVNGCKGIAVGLTCEIPNHNLEEIVSAMKDIVKKGDKFGIKDLLKSVKGPDYKYGGRLISTEEDLKTLYETGKGKISYECEYTLSKYKMNTLLTITGYCPNFNPASFQDDMIKLIEDGVVISANDSSTKTEPCKFEVILKNEDVFEKYVHKYIQKSVTYQLYALDRTKSKSEDKDIDTKILMPNMIDLMKMWVNWRKEVETKVIAKEKDIIENKKFKTLCRLDAATHLDIVKKGLESDDTIGYYASSMPFLKKNKRADEGAKYISDLKIGSIKKMDIDKIKDELNGYEKELESLNNDLSNIDKVVLRELDKLKKFYKPRNLKV